jgi:nucleotidyltransferase substrate binding protein (TIGR01987 family)
MDPGRIAVDATTQRFEFAIELFWRFLQQILLTKGIEVHYPKDVLKKAYAGRLIDDEKMWLAMLNDRNALLHVYDEQQADIIYDHIKKYAPFLQQSFSDLEQHLDEQ